MIGWQEDKLASDRFIPHIQEVLGRCLIGIASVDEDQERNTDLIVLSLKSVRIACRVRSESYQDRFGDEFTIRSSRPRGTKTELAKVIEGWGDYILYGFGSDTEPRLTQWHLGDLCVFRSEFCRFLYRNDKNVMPGTEKKNHDGSSCFRVFKWSEFPPSFVVASSVNPNNPNEVT